VIKGLKSLPYTRLDSKTNSLVSYGINYKKITKYLESKNIEYDDQVLDMLPLGQLPKIKLKLRDYQKEAIESWSKEKMGSIVLPTGAGKTMIGVKIIEKINELKDIFYQNISISFVNNKMFFAVHADEDIFAPGLSTNADDEKFLEKQYNYLQAMIKIPEHFDLKTKIWN